MADATTAPAKKKKASSQIVLVTLPDGARAIETGTVLTVVARGATVKEMRGEIRGSLAHVTLTIREAKAAQVEQVTKLKTLKV